MQEKKPRRGIQSVEIAFRILSVMQTSQQAMALKDIAPLAGLTTSAANNYLVSLVRIGLAAADEKPGHYRLEITGKDENDHPVWSSTCTGLSVLRFDVGYECDICDAAHPEGCK